VNTHLTHVNGAGPELAELVRDDQQEKFASMKQTNRESIGDFLKRLKHAYTLLIVAGVPEYTEPQKAIHFLKRLDPHRHGMMYAEMINRAHRNEPLPQTLFAAYTIASNYLVKKTQSSFATMNTVSSTLIVLAEGVEEVNKVQVEEVVEVEAMVLTTWLPQRRWKQDRATTAES
jgi:hypothetical protein